MTVEISKVIPKLAVNVNDAYERGQKQMMEFEKGWPEAFY